MTVTSDKRSPAPAMVRLEHSLKRTAPFPASQENNGSHSKNIQFRQKIPPLVQTTRVKGLTHPVSTSGGTNDGHKGHTITCPSSGAAGAQLGTGGLHS